MRQNIYTINFCTPKIFNNNFNFFTIIYSRIFIHFSIFATENLRYIFILFSSFIKCKYNIISKLLSVATSRSPSMKPITSLSSSDNVSAGAVGLSCVSAATVFWIQPLLLASLSSHFLIISSFLRQGASQFSQ